MLVVFVGATVGVLWIFFERLFYVFRYYFATPHRGLNMLVMGLVTQSGNKKTQMCSLIVFSLGIYNIHLQQSRKVTTFKQ